MLQICNITGVEAFLVTAQLRWTGWLVVHGLTSPPTQYRLGYTGLAMYCAWVMGDERLPKASSAANWKNVPVLPVASETDKRTHWRPTEALQHCTVRARRASTGSVRLAITLQELGPAVWSKHSRAVWIDHLLMNPILNWIVHMIRILIESWIFTGPQWWGEQIVCGVCKQVMHCRPQSSLRRARCDCSLLSPVTLLHMPYNKVTNTALRGCCLQRPLTNRWKSNACCVCDTCGYLSCVTMYMCI